MNSLRTHTIGLLIALLVSSTAWGINNEQLRVGVILPLSGPLAEYGIAAKNGIQLAVREHPTLFSNVGFIFEDSRYEGKLAVSAFRKLTEQDRVELIYVWGSAPTQVVAPLAERMRLPTFGLDVSTRTNANKKYVVLFSNHAAEFTEPLVSFFKKKNFKKIAIVKTELSFINSLLDSLTQSIDKSQSIKVVDSYDINTQDFKSSIAKLKQGDFDVVGVFLASGQIAQFYRQAKAQNLNLPSFGTDFFESQTEIDQAGGGMEGAVFPFNSVSKHFKFAYVEKHKNDLQLPEAARAFDFAILVGENCQLLGLSCSGKNILKKVQAPMSEHGTLGTYYFTNTALGGRYAKFPVFLRRIHGNTIQTVLVE